MARAAEVGRIASAEKQRADLPNSFCAFLTFTGFRPMTTIRAPCSRKARAAERPRPVVPPMMTSDLPLRSLEAIRDPVGEGRGRQGKLVRDPEAEGDRETLNLEL